MKKINLTKFMSRTFSLALSMSLLLEPIAPVFANGLDAANMTVGTGDAAKVVPDVDAICDALDNAKTGAFMEKDGRTAVKIMTQECSDMGKRAALKLGDACYKTMPELLGDRKDDQREAEIEKICTSSQVNSNQTARVFCSLQQAAKTTQAGRYCSAYRSAKDAQRGVKIIAALDAAAAGICWAEVLSTQKLRIDYKTKEIAHEGVQKAAEQAAKLAGTTFVPTPFVYKQLASTASPLNVFNTGACGGAAMAAGLAELVQTAGVALSSKHVAGDQSIDGDGNVTDKNGSLSKIAGIVLNGAGSLAGLAIGMCYYPGTAKMLPWVCKPQNSAGEVAPPQVCRLAVKENIRNYALLENALNDGGGNNHALSCEMKTLKTASDLTYEGYVKRSTLAKQAAVVFTGLVALRAVSLTSAEGTKNKAKDYLQSLFTGEGQTKTFGMSGVSAAAAGFLTAPGSNLASGNTAPVSSAAIVQNTPEAFLLPQNSPLTTAVNKVAPKAHAGVESAAASGAGGMAGLVAALADSISGPGASGAVHASMATAFANLPKEGGGYSGGGAARSLATKESSGGDLNLKSLFGSEEKEHISAGREDVAFRDLASADDIWHSKNPKGNNLFQIISDKYDTVQRRTGF